MIAKFMTALFSLLIFCMIGCGEDPSSILKSETQPAVSPAVFEDVLISDDAPAAPRMCLPRSLMCMEWHELTQTQRNRKILERAYQDLDQKKKECKEWIQDIVFNASDGEVYPPQNHILKDRWIDDPENTNSEYCIGRSGPITSARPGEIVQVRWKESYKKPPRNLHTFIVVSVNALTITVIDSNAEDQKIVRERDMNISNFDKIADSFSIYYIR